MFTEGASRSEDSHSDLPSEVTCDRLGRLSIRQPQQGYRFSIDSLLLAHFASYRTGPVADLGAGCGIISLLLAARGLPGPFLAVELDPLAADCCRKNFVQAALPGQVLNQDLKDRHPCLAPGSFALVISNPPFGLPGQGILPQGAHRTLARHQLETSWPELLDQTSRLLPKGGRLALCLPPRIADQVLEQLPARRLTAKRLRLAHGRQNRPASLVLLEAVKDGGRELKIEPPLLVYGQGQNYTPEVAAIYESLK